MTFPMVPLSGSWYGHPCNIPQEEIVCVKSVLIAPFFFWDGVAGGMGLRGLEWVMMSHPNSDRKPGDHLPENSAD